MCAMKSHDSVVTLEELSIALQLSKRWLKRETRAGRLPFLQAGRRRMYSVSAVKAELAERAKREGVARG